MVYALLAHIMVIVSILAMMFFMFVFVLQTTDSLERFIRVIAISGGIFTFLGAKFLEVSIPELMLTAIDPTGGFISKLFIGILPGLSGAFVTYFLFDAVEKGSDDERKIYFLLFISSIIIMLFSDIYLKSFHDGYKSAIAINISFMVGLIITSIFRIDILKSIYGFFNKDIQSIETGKSWKDDYED